MTSRIGVIDQRSSKYYEPFEGILVVMHIEVRDRILDIVNQLHAKEFAALRALPGANDRLAMFVSAAIDVALADAEMRLDLEARNVTESGTEGNVE